MVELSDVCDELTPGQEQYDRLVRRRLRVANTASRMRAGGIQGVWLVILIAGAAIPLSDALISDGWSWVSPLLGHELGDALVCQAEQLTDVAQGHPRLS